MKDNILKLYISNLLTGLVFWYGIEKLFMQSIGIDATGVGIATAVMLAFNLLFDIPAGILADRWSRKNVLIISAVSMALCSVILGSSHGLALYLVGYLLYGCYVVTTNGTYHAIIYDSLHEKGQTDQYSKVMGRAYALFLAGAGLANILSGFIAHKFGFPVTYFITLVPCTLNVVLMLSLHEPAFHKEEHKERILTSLGKTLGELWSIKLLRSLTIISTALAIVELFKGEFSQLYMLRYIHSPESLGLLWAAYAFTWSLGSLVAHRFRAHVHTLMFATILPLVVMGVLDNGGALVFFMLQAVASAALLNQIETRVQEATPSGVRASVLSALSTLGRGVSIPASFLIGWLIRSLNSFVTVQVIAVLGVAVLVYWLWVGKPRLLAMRLKSAAPDTVPV